MNLTPIHLRLLVCLLGLSFWSSLRAQCPQAGIDTLVYETFEAGLPTGWSAPRSSEGARWQVNHGDIGYYPNPGSQQWLYISDEAANNVGQALLETPRYDLAAFQGDVELSFDLLFQEYADSGLMTLSLWANGAWQLLLQDSLDFSGRLQLDLSAYAGGEIALRITYDDEGSWGWGLGLDNFLLTGRVSQCGNGRCDPGESPTFCPEDCPYLAFPAPGWVALGRDLAGQSVTYRHFKGGTRCDDCSEEIPLSFDLALFGETYRSLWINVNGNLSFGDPYKPYTPAPFCLMGPRLIAPFYADADLNAGGELRYFADPNGQYLIITWLRVGYYGCGIDCERSNTFQVILTNGEVTQVGTLSLSPGTNIIFNYGDMQWTTGNSSGGVGGLGGSAATVGLNAGDGHVCEGYGRYDQTGYAHLPGSAQLDCPAGGVSHLDYQTLLFAGEWGLPVTAVSPQITPFALAGEAQPGGNVLSWSLQAAGNTRGFRVERSTDGTTFTPLADLALGDHSGGTPVPYRYTDVSPLTGPNLYRVQQLGPNQESLYQATVQVMRADVLTMDPGPPIRALRAAPNPFSDQTLLSFVLVQAGEVQYRLSDLSGRQIRQGRFDGKLGENGFRLAADPLPAGAYLLSLRFLGAQQSIRVIKR